MSLLSEDCFKEAAGDIRHENVASSGDALQAKIDSLANTAWIALVVNIVFAAICLVEKLLGLAHLLHRGG